MKKLIILATVGLLFSGVSFGHGGDKGKAKKTCKKGDNCCKKKDNKTAKM